ncbi:hypothetical protein ZWY2020_032909 [Hordeum vulgare]|nr:hypothetical protein ZWY2020_032909 [Hordeum vulgare]
MVHYAGGSSSGAGGALESNWPLNLDKPLTEELHRYGILVPPRCRLAKSCKVSKDGFPTLPPPRDAGGAPDPSRRPSQRPRPARFLGRKKLPRRHHPAPAGVGGGGQPRRHTAPPEASGANPPPPPVAPPEYELPPERFVLREDGDPDDSPGLLVALRASQTMGSRERRKRRRSRRRSRRRWRWR